MWEDFWMHRFADDPKLANEVEDDEWDLTQAMREAGDDDWEPDTEASYE